jgi:hypothetical protein
MGLAAEGLEIDGVWRILELLNVGVVDLEPELVQFALNVAEDAALEDLALGEDLFHGHARNQDTGFALDDALDDVLEELAVVGTLVRA